MCWDNPRGSAAAGPSVAAPGLDATHTQLGASGTPSFGLAQGFPASAGWPLPLSGNPHSFYMAPIAPPLSYEQLYALKQPLMGPPIPPPASAQPPLAYIARPGDSLSPCDSQGFDQPWTKRQAVRSEPEAEAEEEEEEGAEVGVEEAEEEVYEEPEDATEALPDECLSQILASLEDVEDRMACALVCRRWLHVASLSKKKKRFTPGARVPPAAPCSSSPAEGRAGGAGAAAGTATEAADPTSDVDVVSGLSRTLEGASACDARLMAMAIALSDKGGLEKLVVRGTPRAGGAAAAGAPEPLPLTASGFQAIAQSSPDLRSVTVWDCDWLDDETVMVVARLCPQLEKLDVMNCPRLSDKSLIALARGCPRLSFLSLSQCHMVTDRGLQVLARGCKLLVSLSLASCPYVQGKGVAALAAACKGLTGLKLAGGLGITDEGFRVIAESAASVTHLRLYQLKRLSEEGFRSLSAPGSFPRLSCLSVAGCVGLTSGALEAVGQGCGSLKTLTVVSCGNVSDAGLLLLLRGAQLLESLTLQSLPGISNEAARHALEHGRHLRALTISDCAGVQDQVASGAVAGPGAGAWPVGCAGLATLKVANCVAVGDGCLTSLGRVGASLSSLDLCGLRQAGDKGVLAFLEHSQGKLSNIDLSGCAQVTDKAVASIAEQCGESVRSLCLDGCARVTDKSLRALAKGCPALEDLDLSHCDVTDRGVKALLHSLGHSLVNLSLAGCVRITDKTVEEIMDGCHALSGLNLKNCSGLSRAAVERLRRQVLHLLGPSCLFIDP